MSYSARAFLVASLGFACPLVSACADGASDPALTGPLDAKGGGGSNQAPVANPGGPYSGTVGTAIKFDGSKSYDPDGPSSKLRYAWDFDGNGTTDATSVAPSYTYTAGGDYTVRLKVTDGKGAVGTATTTATVSSSTQPAVLVAAGDIAHCDVQGDEATAALLDNIAGTVVPLGDNAYESGTTTEYNNCYGPSWGRHKARTRPAVGNHEYQTSGASGYFDYFGTAAGERGKGYYSYDVGEWHIIVLNSNVPFGGDCAFVSCAAGSAQEKWLRADLAANPKKCTLAYWHHPLFSSGNHGNYPEVRPLWDALYEAGADVVLAAHDHSYERFAPQRPDGTADTARGIRQFVIGTGGKSLYGFKDTKPNSEKRYNATAGVLKLTLDSGSYSWEFIPTEGAVADSGTGTCH